MGMEHPMFGWCRLDRRGYPRISAPGPYKHKYLHVAVWERTAGREVPEGWQVHHQNWNKLCVCDGSLIAMPRELNPSPAGRGRAGRWKSVKRDLELIRCLT